MAEREKRRRATALDDDERRGRRKQEEAALILWKIRGLVRWVVAEVGTGRSPSVALHRYQNYCASASASAASQCICSYDAPVGTDVLSLLRKEFHASRLTTTAGEQALLQEGHLLHVPLHFYRRLWTVRSMISAYSSSAAGIISMCLVMGWIRFVEGEKKVYCITKVNAAFSIPVSIEAIKDVVSVAHYILVVEKETVFQRLANDKFCERNRCIVITGRGYPDIPTRRFLRYLVEELRLPAYCLVDSDPYGFDILATYKFGSMQLAYDAHLLRVPEIRWLGIFTSDFEEYRLPDCCLLHLSSEGDIFYSLFQELRSTLFSCYI